MSYRESGAWVLGMGLASGIPAQVSVDVPAVFAVTEAPGVDFWALSPFDARHQLLIGQSHLTALNGRPLQGIWVRRNMGDLDTNTGGRLRIEVWMSHSALSASAMGPNFASNRGLDQTCVLDNYVNLPTAPPAGSTPAPWQTPFAVQLAFEAPFVYQGGTLCVETVTWVDNQAIPWWPVDAMVETAGGVATTFGPNCVVGMGAKPAGADAGMFAPGGTAAFWFRGARANLLAMCCIGTSDAHWGGVPLPLDLSSLGAPGCELLTELAITVPQIIEPLPNSPLGVALCEVPIPPLGPGTRLYSQWLLLDPGSNPLNMTFSNGTGVVIGPIRPTWDIGWLEAADPNASSGMLLPGRLPVLRLDG